MLFRMMKDKPVRDTLKKYGLSSQGKREILQERYDAFRIEVQTANDKHERATYEQCARRVERKERQRQGLPFAAAVGGGNRAGMEAELELLQRMWSVVGEECCMQGVGVGVGSVVCRRWGVGGGSTAQCVVLTSTHTL